MTRLSLSTSAAVLVLACTVALPATASTAPGAALSRPGAIPSAAGSTAATPAPAPAAASTRVTLPTGDHVLLRRGGRWRPGHGHRAAGRRRGLGRRGHRAVGRGRHVRRAAGRRRARGQGARPVAVRRHQARDAAVRRRHPVAAARHVRAVVRRSPAGPHHRLAHERRGDRPHRLRHRARPVVGHPQADRPARHVAHGAQPPAAGCPPERSGGAHDAAQRQALHGHDQRPRPRRRQGRGRHRCAHEHRPDQPVHRRPDLLPRDVLVQRAARPLQRDVLHRHGRAGAGSATPSRRTRSSWSTRTPP